MPCVCLSQQHMKPLRGEERLVKGADCQRSSPALHCNDEKSVCIHGNVSFRYFSGCDGLFTVQKREHPGDNQQGGRTHCAYDDPVEVALRPLP